MKQLIRNLLVVAVAFVGSMPVHADATSSSGACDAHGGIRSGAARPAGRAFDDVTGESTACGEDVPRADSSAGT